MPTVKRDNGNVDITFQVTEGPLNVVQDLTIEGNKTLADAQFAPHGLNLGPGKPYSQDLVSQGPQPDRGAVSDAGISERRVYSTAKPVPGQPHQLDVVYQITEGPQVKTATIITDGRQHTQQSLINKNALADARAAERERDAQRREPSVQHGHFRLGRDRSQARHHRSEQRRRGGESSRGQA